MEKCQIFPFVEEGLSISHDSVEERNQLLKRHNFYSESERTILISKKLVLRMGK